VIVDPGWRGIFPGFASCAASALCANASNPAAKREETGQEASGHPFRNGAALGMLCERVDTRGVSFFGLASRFCVIFAKSVNNMSIANLTSQKAEKVQEHFSWTNVTDSMNSRCQRWLSCFVSWFAFDIGSVKRNFMV
jgi:hypothetical protein